MRYGSAKHYGPKIHKAFWRSPPAGMNKIVSIRVEIGRSMRNRPMIIKGGQYALPRKLGPGYAARACLKGARQATVSRTYRCAYGEGRSPTLALKLAVKKLMRKTK